MKRIILQINRPVIGAFGTKTDSLISLIDAGIMVPDFWGISNEEFERFIAFFDIPSFADFVNKPFDPSVEQRVIECSNYIDLSLDLGLTDYIVRSSSMPWNITSNYASMISGAFESYECKADEIGSAVAKVYASMYSSKAYYQIKACGAENSIKGMSVIIQRYIKPLISGVAHYYTNKNVIEIDWVWGHLRDIVSGLNNGNHCNLFQSDNDVVLRGRENDIFDIEQNNLGCAFVELFNILNEIAKVFNTNVEVEWLFDGKKLFVVQAQELIDL